MNHLTTAKSWHDARIYLPLLLAVLAIAGLCFWLFLR